MVLFGLFRFAFFCFGLIETQKLAVSVWNRNNRNKHFFWDSAETSFGSIFGCFESKLVSLDTLVISLQTLLGQYCPMPWVKGLKGHLTIYNKSSITSKAAILPGPCNRRMHFFVCAILTINGGCSLYGPVQY